MPLVVVGERQLELTAEQAHAVVERLWRGLEPGAAMGAATLTTALRVGEPVVRFAPYEASALLSALEALGLDSPAAAE